MIDGLLSVRRGFAAVAAVLTALLAIAPAANAQSQIAAVSSPTARVWFYQDASPYVGINYANVAMNGVAAGSVPPYGAAIYRDVPPGHYRLTAETGGTDVNQSTDVDLAPGQEVYVKVMNLTDWATSNLGSMRRDTFYMRVVPPAVAQAELGQPHRF